MRIENYINQQREMDMLNSSRKILVVDDDDSVRDLCTEVLSVAGYQVDTASQGVEGLERLRRGSYDLVISDVNMPPARVLRALRGSGAAATTSSSPTSTCRTHPSPASICFERASRPSG